MLTGISPDDLQFNDPPVIIWLRVQDAAQLLWRDNPKLHDIGALCESIARYGYKEPSRFAPLLYRIGQADDQAPLGAFESGNGRIEALAKMEQARDIEMPRGLAKDKDGAWCVWVVTGTDAASRAMAESYAVDSNNLTMAGGDIEPWVMARIWSEEAYARLLKDLARQDALPVSVDGDDLDALLREIEPKEQVADPGAQVDKAAELQERWGTAVGQIWQIGKHKLAIGDCTNKATIEAISRGEIADSVVTDPPYGIGREGILNDDPGGLCELYTRCLDAMPICNAIVIAFQSPRLYWVWLDAVRVAGHKPERMLWMYKPNDETFPWRGWLQKSEAILISSLGNGRWIDVHPYAHDCYSPTTLGQELPKEWERAHTSVKPLAVVQDLVSRVGGIVYDPFVGSGTTIVACERLGRICWAVELSPASSAVAIQRLVDMGLEPRLVES